MQQQLPEGFVYELPPIDWWTGWSTIEAAIQAYEGAAEKQKEKANLERIVRHAQNQFENRTMWEGDVIQGPFLGGLPPATGDPTSDVMVALKQMNNGMVFVWSPYELLWLEAYKPGRYGSR